ncbi:MAG TPA: hypothetical protein PKA00_12775 [Saprospiraceae bacterium]|nr:hypothetical protein [Saprospiraceae bacterium]HMQ83782.1 hypothetical protein [Saprospiraceae bacterium]
MAFKDVVGQLSIKTSLINRSRAGRMPHANLLLGATGSGTLALALALTQYLLCEQATEDDACGVCSHCQKTSRFIHPDVHFSFPTIGANAISDHFLPEWRQAITAHPYMDVNQWLQKIGAENKQGNITKEECVSIIRKLSLKTFEDNPKILLMWLPEFLGKEGNRLLKMIEEPPDNTIFILVAEDQHLILNTILSRCQLITVHPLGDEEIVGGLMEKGLTSDEAHRMAFFANGNFQEALVLTEQESDDSTARFLTWMRQTYKGHPVEMVNWVEDFSKLGREQQKHFLKYALHFLRELMVIKIAGALQVRLRGEELDTATKMSAVLELDQIEHLVKLFNDCIFSVERNAHPKILFLDASIKMHQIMRQKSLETYQGLPYLYMA